MQANSPIRKRECEEMEAVCSGTTNSLAERAKPTSLPCSAWTSSTSAFKFRQNVPIADACPTNSLISAKFTKPRTGEPLEKRFLNVVETVEVTQKGIRKLI